jgi:hypothetical protein
VCVKVREFNQKIRETVLPKFQPVKEKLKYFLPKPKPKPIQKSMRPEEYKELEEMFEIVVRAVNTTNDRIGLSSYIKEWEQQQQKQKQKQKQKQQQQQQQQRNYSVREI